MASTSGEHYELIRNSYSDYLSSYRDVTLGDWLHLLDGQLSNGIYSDNSWACD